jgi:hypothetical protein
VKLAILNIISILAITPWVWNLVKLTNCDFESSYKCEVIHGLGVVVPPASYITVWFADDPDEILKGSITLEND